jgi:PleD family two-component response regulator
VTVSVGAALARAGEAAGDLLRRADAQLYRAKSAGRDRVCGGES